jgi:membrane-anchored glycerophosphoryl diester phosphodiesterase (GDPDase)
MYPVESRTFGALISDSLSILKRNTGIISKTILVFWIVPLIPVLLTLIPLIQRWPADLKIETMDESKISPELAALIGGLFFCGVIFALMAVIGYILIVSIAVADREEVTLRLREHLSPVIKRNLWWIIIIFIAEMIFSEIASAPVQTGEAFGGIAYVIVSSVISSYFAVKLYAVVPALILEDAGVSRGIRRSWQLTKGLFFQTLGRYFAIAAISAAVVMVPFMFGMVAASMAVKSSGASNIIEGMQDFGTMMTIFLFFLPSLILMMMVLVIEPIFRSEVFYDLRVSQGEMLEPELAE